MKYKVAELTGENLSYAVAVIECRLRMISGTKAEQLGGYYPHLNWQHGGPIIDRNLIDIEYGVNQGRGEEFHCRASAPTERGMTDWYEGDTALIAAMRAFLSSHHGEFVELQ